MKKPRVSILLSCITSLTLFLSACTAGSPAQQSQTSAPATPAALPASGETATPVPMQDQTAVILTSTPAPATPTEPPAGGVSLGYSTGDQKSFDAVKAETAHLTMVSSDVFTIQTEGGVSGGDDLGVLAYDKEHGLRTFACISNFNSDPEVNDFDANLAHEALFDHADDLISTLVALAQDDGYDGINIDFENIAASENIEDDRAAFTQFIHNLAAQLHENNLQLILSVPAKLEDSADNTWTYPYDLAAIGQDVDYLQLMTYDEHGMWSEPGAVSGADWVEQSIQYVVTLVDPSKILIGLPAYGYNWDMTASDPENATYSAVSFPWTEISTLMDKPGAQIHWDDLTKSPSVSYTEDGHDHQAWYENAQSLGAKTALVKTYHLGGISVWSMGQEDASFWQAVQGGK
jgi:spore germination protein YaaH